MGTENWETMDIDLWNVVSSDNSVKLQALVKHRIAENCCRSFSAGKNNILHIAAKFGSIECATFISNQVSTTTLRGLLIQPNSRGNTPLHCATLSSHSNLVHLFVSKINDIGIELKNNMGDTALHLAVAGDSHEDLKNTRILVERCPILGKEYNFSKEYPIYIAAERGSLEILQFLLRFRDFPVIGRSGKTALHAALARRNVEIFTFLVENRRELVAQKDDQGNTPLHYVASSGDLEMARSILNARSNQYIAHIPDNTGISPIHVAAFQGHVKLIQLILQSRPDSFELVDNNGRNFLHVAVNEGRKNVVKYVIENGELKYLLSNQQDNNGDTPLHLAVRNHNLVMVKLLLKIEKLSKVLRNSDGMTALDLMDSEFKSSPNFHMLSSIGGELIMSGAEFSTRRLDGFKWDYRNKENIVSHLQSSSKNVIIASVLIATVTFTAGLTIPGSYVSDSASPNTGFAGLISHITAYKIFILSNALAMITSFQSIFFLINGIYFHDQFMIRSEIERGKSMLLVSFGGMIVAFAMGSYVVISPDLQWFAELFLILFILCPIIFVLYPSVKNLLFVKNWWTLKGCKWWGSKFYLKPHFL